MSRHLFSIHPSGGVGLLIVASLLLTGCSGEQQPPGEVIEIEMIEMIEPDAPAEQSPTAESPVPPESPTDASN